MSERHSVGNYDLEVSGHELVVRDARGDVVEMVDLEKIDGEFQLPNGQQVDLASLLLKKEIDPADFETAAGDGEGAGSPDSGPIAFRAFASDEDGFTSEAAAGTLQDTSLTYNTIDSDQAPADEDAFAEAAIFTEPTIPVTWAPHEYWNIPENQSGGDFGRLVDGDPTDFTFVVSDDRFEVVDGVLQLKDGFSFDFETESFIDVEITATSKTGDSKTQSVRIDVIDENEGQTSIDLDNAVVAENAAGAAIGKLTVSDPDAGDSQSFQLSDNRFEVVNGQLKLKDGVSLDFETEPSVNVTVTAIDKGGNSISQQFTIVVGDVNEAQSALSLDQNAVSENAAGAVIGSLTVADQDAGDSQSFVVSDNRFEIVDGQLKLKDGMSLDFEAEQTIDMTVTATDKAGHSISQDFSIVVRDVNEAQTALSLNGAYVAENAAGAVIGDLTVADPDKGDSQTFVVSDNRFEVVNGQLKLKDGVSLDFETEPTVNVIVTATDKGGHSIAEQFTLGVGNVNEVQTGLDIVAGAVAENAKGAVVGKVVATDPDAGDIQSFSVSDNRFEIVNSQLKLKKGVSLNYESEPNVNLTVTATDKAGHQIAQAVTINALDVNEKQTKLTLQGTKVAENASGAVIGTLSVADPDANDQQSFKVSDNRFEVVGGQLKLKDGISLDHEAARSINVTVTATDQGGHQISKTFKINVANVNEAQTDMSLSSNKIVENSSGAVVGTLTVADPDAGDKQSFKVSDNRFEVVGGQLKLKSGVSLDFEQTPSIDVTVTATDKGKHQYSETFTVGVSNVNEAPTAIQLSGSSVAENVAGATIGKLTTTDPDAGETFNYQVSDNRFEVVNDSLKLKSGISLDYETEPSVNLKITSTDGAGHAIQQSLTVNVANVNEAPVVTVKDGSVASHIIDVNNAYGPSASATVGAYLYSNDSAGLKVPSSSLLNGVDTSNMTLTSPTEVTVTFQKEAAGNRNMVGTYQYDSNGNIIAGSVKFVWLDASAGAEGKLRAAMVNDFLGYAQANTISLGTMAAGTHVGFFTISNGASDSGNRTMLADAAAGTSTQAAAMAAITSQLSIKVDASGNGHVFVGSSQMNGDVFFSHNKSLNTDFNGGSDIDHMASGVSSSLGNQLLIGVEDLNGGGDRDYNDVVFSVNLGTYNVNQTTQRFVQPNVDFSDVDSHGLSQAVIHSTGFQAGDALNVPASSLFNVNVVHGSNDYTITITGKSGAETVDQYESFVNSITFSTSSKTEGVRGIDYNVVDEGGLTSNVSHATIGVTNSYEISVSQLGAGQNTLGTGNDHLYMNASLTGKMDFSDGYDTLHLAKQDQSLGHGDAVKLSNVEAIDATGYGMNKVALSITDVLDMTDGSNHLTVLGDKGDTVALSGDGSGHHWSVVSTGNDFTTYVWSDPVHQAVVEISNQLTATLSS